MDKLKDFLELFASLCEYYSVLEQNQEKKLKISD